MRSFNRILTILVFAAVLVALVACQPIQPIAGETSGASVDSADVAPISLAGDWIGTLHIANTPLRIEIKLTEDASGWSGTISIPQQGATNLPLHSITIDGDAVHMEMLEGSSLAVFEGIASELEAISGTFTQAGYSADFTLARDVPQQAEVLPYRVELVTFESSDATLAGTLTLPQGDGPFPAIVLVSGSGPQNRDEEIALLPDYAPFRVIADRLTTAGFAVLRYDDRGVGESTGDFASATTTTFADDARAAIAWLRANPEIDPAQVGILGHSEGSNVAAMVGATDPDLSYIVAWAGPAVSGEEVIVLQSGLQMERAGGQPEDVAQYRAELRQAIQHAVAGDTDALRIYLDNVIRAAYVQLPDDQQAALGPMEKAIAEQVEAQMESLLSPWTLEFYTYDPASDWAKVTSPVLAFFGGLDTQVDANQNRGPLAAALVDNNDVTIHTLPTANHLFVEAQTGAVSEYAYLKPDLLPEFLDVLTEWLTAHATFAE